jgi:hypothetical protein
MFYFFVRHSFEWNKYSDIAFHPMQIISKDLITMLSILKRTLGAVCIILAFHSKANVADLDVLIVTEHLPTYQISKDSSLLQKPTNSS